MESSGWQAGDWQVSRQVPMEPVAPAHAPLLSHYTGQAPGF